MQASPGFYEPELTSRENRRDVVNDLNQQQHLMGNSLHDDERELLLNDMQYKKDMERHRSLRYKRNAAVIDKDLNYSTSQEELSNPLSSSTTSHVMIKVPMMKSTSSSSGNSSSKMEQGSSSSSAAAISEADMINIHLPSNNAQQIIVQCVNGQQQQQQQQPRIYSDHTEASEGLLYSSSAAGITGNYPIVLLPHIHEALSGSKNGMDKQNNNSNNHHLQQQQQQQQQQLLQPPPIPSKNHVAWNKLRNLEELYKEGIIKDGEYKERRQQLVDELTGTRSLLNQQSSSTGTSYSSLSSFNSATGDDRNRTRRSSSRSFSPIVVPRPPPDFSTIQPELALKIYFDLPTRTWTTKQITVRLDDTPFARGGLRLVYHILEEGSSPPRTGANIISMDTVSRASLAMNSQIDTNPNTKSCLSNIPLTQSIIERPSFCAKMAIDPNEDPSSYFRDVEMQAHCAYYAAKFNEYNPPRRVEFCKAWILELIERDGSPLVCVERFIAGPYRKHNNNFGYVSDDERNTPQAFSHFTYEVSAHTMLVVDIQGVGDLYTDPQIHTITGRDFGKGNLGLKGFEKFLKTHRCNSICRFLKLPPVNPKYTADGTVPNFPYMLPAKIEKERFEASHIFERTPALQKYLYGRNLTNGEEDLYNIQRTAGARRRKSGGRKNSAYKKGFYHEDKDAFFWSASEDESCGWCHFPACSIL